MLTIQLINKSKKSLLFVFEKINDHHLIIVSKTKTFIRSKSKIMHDFEMSCRINNNFFKFKIEYIICVFKYERRQNYVAIRMYSFNFNDDMNVIKIII